MIANPRRLAWVACMAMALLATPTFASLRLTAPPKVTPSWPGFEFGPWISASAPTGLADEAFNRGMSAGVTFTKMEARKFGIGLDLAYGHWPAPAAAGTLDALFSSLGSAAVSGTKATLSTLQLGAHAKFLPLPDRALAPWLQIGIGVSRADSKIEVPTVQLVAAGWEVLNSNSDDISYQPTFTTGAGFDVKTGETLKIGLDASYQWQMFSKESQPFTAFTIGGHLLFGRW